MFTRCPQCKTVHPLTAALISYARGTVKCGHCNKSFDALSFLFDQWPSDQAHAPAHGAQAGPPVVGHGVGSGSRSPVKMDPDTKPVTVADNQNRLMWGGLTAILILLTVANSAWTFREPLLQEPKINAWLNSNGWTNGWLQAEQNGLLTDPAQIQLVSRDIHAHPSRTGILVLSLTFVNLAPHSQVFPVLELTLLDASNQAIARRRLQPADYLRAGADHKSGLGTDVFLPVLLELGDPGQQAVGFEIQFL